MPSVTGMLGEGEARRGAQVRRAAPDPAEVDPKAVGARSSLLVDIDFVQN